MENVYLICYLNFKLFGDVDKKFEFKSQFEVGLK